MATSTSYANAAAVWVEIHARGSKNLEEDAARASLAVVEWLDRQDTSTLAADYVEYGSEMNGDTDATFGSLRFAALENAAYKIGIDAAKQGWVCPGADVSFNVSIMPIL